MASRRSSDTPRTPDAVPTLKPAVPLTRVRKSTAPALMPSVTSEARHAMIAEKAYLRAERRGFAAGRETEDWLAAEAEVDALLKLSHGGPPQ